MTISEYQKNIGRLKEIEAAVKDPQSSLDKIDSLLEETKRLAAECYAYTRTLRDKTETLDETE